MSDRVHDGGYCDKHLQRSAGQNTIVLALSTCQAYPIRDKEPVPPSPGPDLLTNSSFLALLNVQGCRVSVDGD